jgi:2-methylcitrate dehydratase
MSVTRRRFLPTLAGVALLPTLAAARDREASTSDGADSSDAKAVGDSDITQQYVDFAVQTQFEQLPPEVVHAATRFVVDSVGCAVAGWTTEKGRIAASLMKAAGGSPEAHILGTNARVSASSAAFANAELMNSLDYDAIPHTPPVTLPAVLALGQKIHASGRSVLCATAVAHELAARLAGASSQMGESIMKEGKTPTVFSINTEAIIGTAAAIASMSGQTPAQVASAMGLAAYYCPPQAAHDWETGSPKSDVKYTPVGIICQSAVIAALLAQQGYTGNPTVLDGPTSFATFYGYRKWVPDAAVAALGRTWRIETVDFKPYACCRFIHSQIDCLRALMSRHQLQARQIESIHGSGPPFAANPDPLNVRTQEDAQFSTPFMLAQVACGYSLDATCQKRERLGDPAVRAMMQRVRWDTLPRNPDPAHYLAAQVEVVAAGRTYVEKVDFPSGSASQGAALTDAELTRKCEANLRTRLTASQARSATRALWDLASAADIGTVIQMLQS